MKLKSNYIKKALRQGDTCFGTLLSILKSPLSITMCAAVGWDFIILDAEHGDYNNETLAHCSLIAKYEDLGLLIRVPDKQNHHIVQALDYGADGVVVPQVNTREETLQILQSAKFAPFGKRGIGISPVVTRLRHQGLVDYMKYANEESLVVIMVESKEGVDSIEKIASIPGVDAVLTGPGDLSQDLGLAGQMDHPDMEAVFKKIIKGCKNHGVAPGIYVETMDAAQKWMKEGMRFIAYGYDYMHFKKGSQEALDQLRTIKNHVDNEK